MKHISTALLLSTVAGLSLGVAHTAHAQTAPRFSTVEFKDTTLSDALEMIFQAANNPAHTIDPSASQVPIGSMTLQNIQWDSALRTLANQNNFKVSRGADGSYLVEPREPVLQEGVEGAPGGFPGAGGFGAPGTVPSNPFGGAGRPSTRNGVTFQMVPSVSTQANAQTNPRFGGGGGGTNNTPTDRKVIPLYVRHIYVGGIAQLFQNSSVIPTEPFVSPESSSDSGGGGGRGGRGGGGRSQGIGGGGGFGGGGFGGGGLGGGGFGGGGFGGGGLGGGSFGGGGFGGGQQSGFGF